MLYWIFGNKRTGAAKYKAPSYEESRETALNGSDDERQKLARCEDLPPEFLYYFATDTNETVRREVAANPGTPLQADLILAKDRAVSVRAVLAKKIAKILPDIRSDQSEKLAELAYEVLELLAEDQSVKVRKMISESIKSLNKIPKPIVQLLARDIDETVSLPVLEYSPLLGEQDLLNLILTGIRGKRLAAVSRREDLTVELIDTIVKTKDEIAVEALIGNENADIPRSTLENIVDASISRVGWQTALASRLSVPNDTLIRLSRFATESVLSRLRARSDLGEDLLAELENAVAKKVGESFDSPQSKIEEDPNLKRAKELHLAGELDEAKILAAIRANDSLFVCAGLAVLSGKSRASIQSILRMQSSKSILALVWTCGLSMKTALAIQKKIMKLPEAKIIKPKIDGGYPLSEEDLSWHSELLFH